MTENRAPSQGKRTHLRRWLTFLGQQFYLPCRQEDTFLMGWCAWRGRRYFFSWRRLLGSSPWTEAPDRSHPSPPSAEAWGEHSTEPRSSLSRCECRPDIGLPPVHCPRHHPTSTSELRTPSSWRCSAYRHTHASNSTQGLAIKTTMYIYTCTYVRTYTRVNIYIHIHTHTGAFKATYLQCGTSVWSCASGTCGS